MEKSGLKITFFLMCSDKNNFVWQFFTYLISLGVILCSKLQIRCEICIAIPEIWVANCDATPLILSLENALN
jgi:hypothetical protein